MKKLDEKYKHLGVILAYTALTLLLTYPLIENFFSHVPGRGFDVFTFLWNFWWVKKALLELHTTPYFSQYVAYPAGEGLALRTFSIFNSLLAVPLQGIFDLAATYNILFFLGFLLSAYGTYLLVRYLTGNGRAAFVSGIIFAFCPYRFAHALAGQLNLLSTGFIPLYVLYLIKADKERGWSNPLLAAVFFLANALCDWHYMCFVIIFSGLYFAYRLWFERTEVDRETIKRCALMIVVSGLLTLPFAYPVIESALFIQHQSVPIEFSVAMSADLLSFFVPSQLHPLLGKYFSGIHDTFTGFFAENDLSVGYSVIALALYYALKVDPVSSWLREKVARAGAIRRDRTTLLKVSYVLLLLAIVCGFFFGQNLSFGLVVLLYSLFFIVLAYVVKDRRIGFWLLSAIVFFVLSLGPLLHVLGHVYYIPLPYIIFPFTPILSLLRDPGRFGLLVMLSLAVVSGYAITDLLAKTKKTNILAISVSALMLFEFLVVPLPLTDLAVPKAYNRLAETAGDFAVLDFPVPGSSSYSARYMYYQTKHEKKIIGGYLGIASENSRLFLENAPVVQAFRFPLLLSESGGYVSLHPNAYLRPGPEYDGVMEEFFLESNPDFRAEDFQTYAIRNSSAGETLAQLDQPYPQGDIVEQNISRIGAGVLSYYNIKYIIVHDEEIGAPEKKAIARLLAEILPDSAPVYAGEGVRIYAVPKTEAVSFAILGAGWYSKEPLESTATRWMSNNATVKTINSQEKDMGLAFAAQSFEKNRTLDVYLNNRKVGEYTVGLNITAINIPNLRFAAGNNTITFYTPDGCSQQPNRFRTMDEEADRCVSISFQNISMASGTAI